MLRLRYMLRVIATRLYGENSGDSARYAALHGAAGCAPDLRMLASRPRRRHAGHASAILSAATAAVTRAACYGADMLRARVERCALLLATRDSAARRAALRRAARRSYKWQHTLMPLRQVLCDIRARRER